MTEAEAREAVSWLRRHEADPKAVSTPQSIKVLGQLIVRMFDQQALMTDNPTHDYRDGGWRPIAWRCGKYTTRLAMKDGCWFYEVVEDGKVIVEGETWDDAMERLRASLKKAA